MKSRNNTIAIALLSAVIGGAATGGTMTLLNNNTASSTTEVSNVNIKGATTMEQAYQKVAPAVVSVVNYQKQNNFMMNSEQSAITPAGEGSGVLYKKNGNKVLLVTNNHVVEGAVKLEIILKDGKKLPAKLIGTDKLTDLAVLEVDGKNINNVAEFGNSDKITEGQQAMAIGSPLGSQYASSVTQGIISSKARTLDGRTTGNGSKTTVIQTDAAINPGNSGGALINAAGQVIGINSMKLAKGNDGTPIDGMGFAIPSNEVVKVINELVKHGSIKRPSLEIGVLDLSQVPKDAQLSVLKLPSNITQGVVVMNIQKTSPLSKSFKEYDVIVQVDGKKITNTSDLVELINSHKLNDSINITHYQDGKPKTTRVTLSRSAQDKQEQRQQSTQNSLEDFFNSLPF